MSATAKTTGVKVACICSACEKFTFVNGFGESQVGKLVAPATRNRHRIKDEKASQLLPESLPDVLVSCYSIFIRNTDSIHLVSSYQPTPQPSQQESDSNQETLYKSTINDMNEGRKIQAGSLDEMDIGGALYSSFPLFFRY